MRVIRGKYKGRNLIGFDIVGTRPTQDRVKESIFSMIQEDVLNASVLDLFAGSGNLGIEALSSGAKECYFVDSNRKAIEVIKKNTRLLGIEVASIFQMDYKKALLFFQKEQVQFDLIFLDPPYQMLVLEEILRLLVQYDLLKEGAIVVCEYETDYTDLHDEKWQLINQKKYGYKKVKIYLYTNTM